jgi:hypothetical protein
MAIWRNPYLKQSELKAINVTVSQAAAARPRESREKLAIKGLNLTKSSCPIGNFVANGPLRLTSRRQHQ